MRGSQCSQRPFGPRPKPITRPAQLQVPITISDPTITSEGDKFNPAPKEVTVRPGDLVLADQDGVVIVPRENVEEVVRLAEKGRAEDECACEIFRAGMPVNKSFAKNRTK